MLVLVVYGFSHNRWVGFRIPQCDVAEDMYFPCVRFIQAQQTNVLYYDKVAYSKEGQSVVCLIWAMTDCNEIF